MKRIYSIAIALMAIAACTEPLNEKGELNGYEDIYDFSGIDTEDLVIKWDNDSDPSNIVLYGHVTNKVNIGCDFPWFGVFDKQTKKIRYTYTDYERPLTAYGENVQCDIYVEAILDNFCVSTVRYSPRGNNTIEIVIVDKESNHERIKPYEEAQYVSNLQITRWAKDSFVYQYSHRLIYHEIEGQWPFDQKISIYNCQDRKTIFSHEENHSHPTFPSPFRIYPPIIHSKEDLTRFDVIDDSNACIIHVDQYTDFEKYDSKSFEVFTNANESDMFDWSEPEKTDYEISWSVTRTTYSGAKETKNVTVTIENGETIVKIV